MKWFILGITLSFLLVVTLLGVIVGAGLMAGQQVDAARPASYDVPPNGLDAPRRVLAGTENIDVPVGHAAPFVFDFDGDGVKDLLVGQFDEGKLRIYKNTATNKAPQFDSFQYFMDGKQEGTVPYG